jgi:hypothetical protein
MSSPVPGITSASWYSNPGATLNSSVTGGFGNVAPAGDDFDLEAWWRRLKNDKARAAAQAQGMRAFTTAPEDPARRFMNIKNSLDYMEDPKVYMYGFNGAGINRDFLNFPAASALAFGQNVFPNGFDTASRMLQASGGVDPTAQAKANNLNAEADMFALAAQNGAYQPRR